MGEMSVKPIIITSLAPGAGLDWQLHCFRTWQALGLEVKTANAQDESAKLQRHGVAQSDILTLPKSDCSRADKGHDVPQIRAVLKHFQERFPQTPLLLVNADIYPAIRSQMALQYWLQTPGVTALTREDCTLPQTHRFGDYAPHRKGLDAFVFSGGRAVGQTIEELGKLQTQKSMCFGIPGWDLLLGALIERGTIEGLIADSGVLLHARHLGTVHELEEFDHFLPDLNRLTGHDLASAQLGVQALQARIDQACRRTISKRQMVKALSFSTAPSPVSARDAAGQIARDIMRLYPALAWHLLEPAIAALAAYELAQGRPDFERAKDFFLRNPDPQTQFIQTLLAIRFCQRIQQTFDAAAHHANRYPEGHLHAQRVDRIRTAHPESSPWRRLELAKLFGADLISDGIFNPIIFNYLVSACETDEERTILMAIRDSVENIANVAA